MFRYPYLMLLLVWVSMALLVQPGGNFPLCDDWNFARLAHTLAIQGRWARELPAGPTSLFQVAVGAFLIKMTGFSYEWLRALGATWGLLGVWVCYFLLRMMNVVRPAALLGALALALCPLYLQLSLTFMTDVPALVLGTAALAMVAWGARRPRRALTATWVACLLAVAAVLTRHTALLPLLGLAMAGLLGARRQTRTPLILWLAPALVACGAYGLYLLWIYYGGPAPPAALSFAPAHIVQAQWHRGLGGSLVWVGNYGTRAWLYWGLGLLAVFPLALVALRTAWSLRGVWAVVVAGLLLGAFGTLLVPNFYQVGYHLQPWGLGPLMLHSAELGSAAYGTGSPLVWVFFSVLGAAMGLLLLLRMVLAWQHRRHQPLLAGCALALALLVLPLALRGYFDRYLLPGLPLALALVLAPVHPAPLRPVLAGWARALTVGLLALLAVVSAAAVHDYMAWNRAVAAGRSHLLRLGVSPQALDAGYAWAGHQAPASTPWADWQEPRPGMSWWYVTDDRYVLAFSDAVLPGHTPVREYPFSQWLHLPPRQHAVVLYRRLDVPPDPRVQAP